MNENIVATYGNRIRIRVCGIAVKDEAILLVKHNDIGKKNVLWIPPGGGVEFGESMEDALKREFLEETGLSIMVKELMFVNEFIEESLHAIELFFEVKIINGQPSLGSDPEMPVNKQILNEIKFVTFQQLEIMDKEILHNALHNVNSSQSLLNMQGHFKFCQ